MADTIYLDYAATTPVDPAVVEAMVRYMGPDGVFANPSSTTHPPGQKAGAAVEDARQQVAALIKASPDEVLWTSGATESINLAIKGVADARVGQGRHIVTTCLEHSAVLDTCRYLAREGYEITLLRPDSEGLVRARSVKEALRADTILVSVMQVNNETGTITDVEAIGDIVGERGIPFHVDAAQSVARLPVDVSKANADFMSLSGHKMYGPKGVGALYIRGRSHPGIGPQIHGGDQEMGLRAGTLPTHQIVGMGKAAALLTERRNADVQRALELEELLLQRLAGVSRMRINGGGPRAAGIVNVRFECVDNESLMMAVRDEVAMSSGSACTSTHIEPSHVLLGLGLSVDEANTSVRLSLGRFTSSAEVEQAACLIEGAVDELRSLSVEWECVRVGGNDPVEGTIGG
ncbi:MAG: aminotransferase class V-fold PLP-dependent enzyme [Gammaproteobacteria bacterium]|nr:aminotransferase class V-fold PLP-dependent enzyme [Gammaproteobacteria bacterium]